MQKSVFSVLTLSIGLAFTTASHADLVQAQPLSNSSETASLANRVLDQDGKSISSALFKMNTPVTAAAPASKPAVVTALSITETAGSRVRTENIPTRVAASNE